ncbi:hypothetical protein [Methanococcoides methylutens]|uniref:Uncharacterized protein n=1 Tax=Methanococcoides methylutens MM1 TaxID=1434104 RepID=A0A0E3SRB3_METMT|nr:hypothetical protein [Methanococcoides methylutens]AKB85416.1 hypothetical protein MCMEM_1363 [Methanococcoides methylutens MM1]
MGHITRDLKEDEGKLYNKCTLYTIIGEGKAMEPIGKSKITGHRPNKDTTYPLIRLPKSYSHLIGETAHFFEIDNNGTPLLVISLDEDFDGNIKIVQSTPSDLETRLESLEKQMKLLEKSLQTTGSSPRKPKE